MQYLRFALVLVISLALCHGGSYDYRDVLNKSLLFYQAQRSGKLSGMNSLLWWRGDSALYDKGNNGEDLTGGYYDAGDLVKFGFPMAYTITVLAWGAIHYQSGYNKASAFTEVTNAIKWGTDYFIKAHVSEFELYGQVGNGELDHAVWERPEDLTMARPAYKITSSAPGSDLAAETAAAFAAAYLVFKNVNLTYANTLLTHAKQLYKFADTYRGKYSDSISDAASFYLSSGYDDELVWGAIWLYRATGDSSYLTKAESYYKSFGIQYKTKSFSWNEKSMGAVVLLAQLTGSQTYKDKIQDHCNSMMNDQQKTPKGLVFINEWGPLRYALNIAFICMQAADLGINTQTYRTFAKKQLDYALGDAGRSFVVGFGNNPPTHVHHRAAECPNPPATCNWNTCNGAQPNAHVLYGALVGGPDANDNYTDICHDAQQNEVACDYNAAFQGVIAGFVQLGY